MRPEPLYRYSLITIAALLPTYLLRFTVVGISTNIFEILIAAVTIVGCLQLSVRQGWEDALKTLPRAVGICLLLFVTATIISTVISPHPETSLGILKGWIFIPLLYVTQLYATAQKIPKIKNQILHALITSGVIVALLGISQIGTLDRIKSVYDVPASLALFLAPLIVLAVTSPHHYVEAGRYQYRLYSSGVMFIALIATQSMSGILAVLTILGIYIVVSRSQFQLPRGFYLLLIWLFLSTVIILLTTPKLIYLQQSGSSAYVRLQLWKVSVDLIREQPLIGVGLGTFEPAYQRKLHELFAQISMNTKASTFMEPLPEWVFRDPHNWILSFWLGTGLLGLSTFTFIHVWIGWGLWKYRDPFLLSIGYALATLLLFGLSDTIFWKNDLATLQFILLTLAVSGLVMKFGAQHQP